MSLIYLTQDGDTVDYVAWKYYGTVAGRVVEKLLDANLGIADRGPILPPGVVITLPEIVREADKVTRLWD